MINHSPGLWLTQLIFLIDWQHIYTYIYICMYNFYIFNVDNYYTFFIYSFIYIYLLLYSFYTLNIFIK